MHPSPRRPVLVTGSNRSGTTWVGRMLCLSRELSYVHEPTNPGIWPRWTPTPVHLRNLYVCPENEGDHRAEFAAIIARRFPWRAQIGEARTPRDAARLARAAIGHRLGRTTSRATLVKDPIAVFSAEWLAERFGTEIVMMVRGPVAFASSIKRLGWAFDFGNWTRQELLLRDHLGEFAEEISRAASHPPELLDQAILTWNATYAYVDRMHQKHPDWHLVSYEKLAAEPRLGFEALYADLGLRFDQRALSGVEQHSAAGNVREVAPRDKGGIQRDSRAALDTWRTRLTDHEVERVIERTGAVASRLGIAMTGAS